MHIVNAELTTQRDIAKPVYHRVIRCEVVNKGEFVGKPTGTLLALVKNPLTPMGIWIDRLEECPEECSGIPSEILPVLIAYLREKL